MLLIPMAVIMVGDPPLSRSAEKAWELHHEIEVRPGLLD